MIGEGRFTVHLTDHFNNQACSLIENMGEAGVKTKDTNFGARPSEGREGVGALWARPDLTSSRKLTGDNEDDEWVAVRHSTEPLVLYRNVFRKSRSLVSATPAHWSARLFNTCTVSDFTSRSFLRRTRMRGSVL